MSNKKRFDIELCPSLNRCVVTTAFPGGNPVSFGILHHKKTSAIQFTVDLNTPVIKNGQYKVRMFRNLEKCMFCQSFFELETVKDTNKDFQAKFYGIKRSMEKNIIVFSKEQYNMTLMDPKRPPLNYLLVLGFKIPGVENDLIYYFVQRKTYHSILRKNVIRTAGIQFANDNGYKCLSEFYENTQNEFKKVNNASFLMNNTEIPKIEAKDVSANDFDVNISQTWGEE